MRVRRSNCLVFAWKAWRREWRVAPGVRKSGGYVFARASHWMWWVPHFLYMDRKRKHVVSFKPLDPKHDRRGLRWLWFKGRMRWGDTHDKPAEDS